MNHFPCNLEAVKPYILAYPFLELWDAPNVKDVEIFAKESQIPFVVMEAIKWVAKIKSSAP